MKYKVLSVLDNQTNVKEHLLTDSSLEAEETLDGLAEEYNEQMGITFWIEQNAGWEIVPDSFRLRGEW